jgi:hypothetical protein
MKKFFTRLLSATLVFVLLFSVPVQASNFNYSMDFFFSVDAHGDVDDDIAVAVGLFSDGVGVSVRGTHVRDGLVVSDFMQIHFDIDGVISAMVSELPIMFRFMLAGMDFHEPVRIWTEIDFNSLQQPEFKMVIELPAVLRLALSMVDETLSAQYIVIDLGDFIADISEELEAEIRQISEEQIQDFFVYFDDVIEELRILFEELREELDWLLAEAWEEIAEFITVRTLEYGLDVSETAAQVFLELDFTVADDVTTMNIVLEFDAAVANADSAARVTLPPLTPENSLDLIHFLTHR